MTATAASSGHRSGDGSAKMAPVTAPSGRALGVSDGYEVDTDAVPRFTPQARVIALTAVLALASAACILLLPDGLKIDRSNMALFAVLTIGFALSEKLILHIEARQDAISYSPSEIGVAIGVLFLFPLELLMARTIGALVGMAVVRRPPAFKLLFNLAHFALESLVALLIFRGLSRFTDDLLVTWLALLAGLTVALVTGGAIVALAISQFEGDTRSRITREIVGTPVFHFPPAMIATLFAVSILVDPRLGILAALPMPVIWFMIRSHGALIHRHLDLESAHDFGRTIGDATDLAGIAAAAAQSMAHGTGAGSVSLRLWAGDETPVDAVVGTGIETGTLPATPGDPGWVKFMSRRETERVDPTCASTPHVLAVRSAGVAHGLMAPIADDRGPLGVVVLASLGDSSAAFDHDSLDRVVEMAQQLAIAVRKARLHSQMEHEAAHDRLTGLPNRSHFEAAVNDCFEDGGKHRGKQAVLLIDLDRFKEINDSFGHHAGDKVLIEVAERIRRAAGAGATAARFGGDEFALTAPGLDARKATRLAERISNMIEAPIDLGQATIAVGASVGIAVAPDHGGDANTLLGRADLAMYDAKTNNEHSRVFSDDLDTTGAARLTLLSDLRVALQQQALSVHYQPQIDLSTGMVVGAEALARWNHREYGYVDPGVFIGLAEQSGLIEELTRQVLSEATAAAAEWQRRGWNMSVSVNISPLSLLDERLEVLVEDSLRASGIDPAHLVLEITETVMMGDASRTHRILHSLARLGVRLSVDDFGTGYSSLTNLRHFPVAELKIDRSFILDLMHDNTDDVIVRSTIELGHNLGLTIVAEGIEDEAVQNRLRELSCDMAQGFAISRPLSSQSLLFWVDSQQMPFGASASSCRSADA